MSSEFIGLAKRIKALRESCGFSAGELARELGISPEVYNEYEQNGENIPISVIYEIANKCGVDLSEILTGVTGKLNTYHVVRRGYGKNISRYPGYYYEDLAFKYAHKIMQPFLVTLCPDDSPAELVSHPGQEFNLVLEGTVAVVFEDKEIILNEGDSIYFNPGMLHGQKCAGSKKARFLSMIAE